MEFIFLCVLIAQYSSLLMLLKIKFPSFSELSRLHFLYLLSLGEHLNSLILAIENSVEVNISVDCSST